MSLLDASESAVLRMIENGELLFAFDLALQPSRARKRELRILPQSLEAYQAGCKRPLEWGHVERMLLPGAEGTVLSVELERVLNVSQSHLQHLLSRKELLLCTRGRRGRGGSARVWRHSAAAFLRRRRWPVAVAET